MSSVEKREAVFEILILVEEIGEARTLKRGEEKERGRVRRGWGKGGGGEEKPTLRNSCVRCL